MKDRSDTYRELIDFLDINVSSRHKSEYILIREHVASEAVKAGNYLDLSAQDADVLVLSSILSSHPLTTVTNETMSLAESFFDTHKNYHSVQFEVITVIWQLQANQFRNELTRLVYDVVRSVYSSKLLFKVENLLREEITAVKGQEFKDTEWRKELHSTLEKQRFLTEYGEQYTLGTRKNLKIISKELKKKDKNMELALQQELHMDDDEFKELKKKYAKIYKRPERGIETLFKLTSKNHYTLNAMVDRKANILISINAIILSIILGTLMNKIYEDPHLILPIILLLTTNLVSIVYAIFATRPDLTHGGITEQSSKHHFLFYGNFHDMREGDYVSGMNALMNDADDLYDSLSKDIFYLGKNLKKKFTHLRRSFNVFMYGLISSVIAFLSCHALFEFLLAR